MARTFDTIIAVESLLLTADAPVTSGVKTVLAAVASIADDNETSAKKFFILIIPIVISDIYFTIILRI